MPVRILYVGPLNAELEARLEAIVSGDLVVRSYAKGPPEITFLEYYAGTDTQERRLRDRIAEQEVTVTVSFSDIRVPYA